MNFKNKVTQFRKAKYSLLKPINNGKLILAFEKMDISVKANFSGTEGSLALPGQLKGDISGEFFIFFYLK